MFGTKHPCLISRSEDHQSYLFLTPSNTGRKESPNVRQNHFNFALTFPLYKLRYQTSICFNLFLSSSGIWAFPERRSHRPIERLAWYERTSILQ